MTPTVKAAQIDQNGTVRVSTVKLVITIIVAMVAVGGATTPAVLAMGRLAAHASDTATHETGAQKAVRIDDRVGLHLKPIEVELRGIRDELSRLRSNTPGAHP